MSKLSGLHKIIEHPLSVAATSVLIVLLVAICIFGFRFTIEEGALVGLFAAIAGLIAIAQRAAERRKGK